MIVKIFEHFFNFNKIISISFFSNGHEKRMVVLFENNETKDFIYVMSNEDWKGNIDDLKRQLSVF